MPAWLACADKSCKSVSVKRTDTQWVREAFCFIPWLCGPGPTSFR